MILLLFKSICIKYTVIIVYLNDLDSWLPFLFTLYTGERLLEVETMVTMRQGGSGIDIVLVTLSSYSNMY